MPFCDRLIAQTLECFTKEINIAWWIIKTMPSELMLIQVGCAVVGEPDLALLILIYNCARWKIDPCHAAVAGVLVGFSADSSQWLLNTLYSYSVLLSVMLRATGR